MPVGDRVNATVTARTYNGGIRSTFPLPADTAGGERRNKRLTLTVGNGSAHVELESFAGTIALRRPGEARPEIERRRRDKDKEKEKEKGNDIGAIGAGTGRGIGRGIGNGIGIGIGRGLGALTDDGSIERSAAEAIADAQPDIDRSIADAMSDVGPTLDGAIRDAVDAVQDLDFAGARVVMPHITPMPRPMPLPRVR